MRFRNRSSCTAHCSILRANIRITPELKWLMYMALLPGRCAYDLARTKAPTKPLGMSPEEFRPWQGRRACREQRGTDENAATGEVLHTTSLGVILSVAQRRKSRRPSVRRKPTLQTNFNTRGSWAPLEFVTACNGTSEHSLQPPAPWEVAIPNRGRTLGARISERATLRCALYEDR
jgi:hypothetical protein